MPKGLGKPPQFRDPKGTGGEQQEPGDPKGTRGEPHDSGTPGGPQRDGEAPKGAAAAGGQRPLAAVRGTRRAERGSPFRRRSEHPTRTLTSPYR